MFTVRYCIEETYRLGNELVVVSIAFEKSFDSMKKLKRVALVSALKCYKCDPRLYEVVIYIYMRDTSEI